MRGTLLHVHAAFGAVQAVVSCATRFCAAALATVFLNVTVCHEDGDDDANMLITVTPSFYLRNAAADSISRFLNMAFC